MKGNFHPSGVGSDEDLEDFYAFYQNNPSQKMNVAVIGSRGFTEQVEIPRNVTTYLRP